MRAPSQIRRFSSLPEANVFLFAFLLHYPWEFLQVPFFAGMEEAPHWDATLFCSRAALGDAAMELVAFWIVAAVVRSRRWVLSPSPKTVALFIALGLAMTLAFEWLATGWLDRWTYAASMPVVPLLGVGALPLVQWLLLPPISLWLVYRQLT